MTSAGFRTRWWTGMMYETPRVRCLSWTLYIWGGNRDGGMGWSASRLRDFPTVGFRPRQWNTSGGQRQRETRKFDREAGFCTKSSY
ncbi:hypothetical protein GBAR_LOCUS28840, partial [Geodia barretti]